MSNRSAQEYLTSGEVNDIKIGGITPNDSVVKQGDVVKVVKSPAYASWKTEPSLTLTSTYQVVTGWAPFIVPLGVTEVSGVFTFSDTGIYEFNLERGYVNPETNPSSPVLLSISTWKNGVLAFERTGIIGSATANDEPTLLSITSPSILQIDADDYFEIKVKAEEGVGVDPTGGVALSVMQITANKLYEV